MNSQNNKKEDSRHLKSAIIGSVFALLAILVGGFFLILNTLVEIDASVITPTTQRHAVSTPTTSQLQVTPTPSSSPTPTATIPPTSTAIILPTSTTTKFKEHSSYTLYWNRTLWEKEISANIDIEDFENENAGTDELQLPYVTRNGFLLTGGKSVQIFQNIDIPGARVHFLGWDNGLTFIFPNNNFASAFGFDYRVIETWQLSFSDTVITMPNEEEGFIGIIMRNNFPREFNLYSLEFLQGGMSVDNISYISTNLHEQ